MHMCLIVPKIPKRWYLVGDALFVFVGQAACARGGVKRRASGVSIGMVRRGGMECKGSGPSALLLANERRLIR